MNQQVRAIAASGTGATHEPSPDGLGPSGGYPTIAGWQPISTAPEDTVVLTKIEDEHCARNEQTLRRRGRLWFVPDGSTYVYYSPTHWFAGEPE